MRPLLLILVCLSISIFSGCATVQKPPQSVEAPVPRVEQRAAQSQVVSHPEAKVLKRKVAIGRFTNETLYGKALLGDAIDPLGRQTSDKLATALVTSGKFIVLERPDLDRIVAEQQFSGSSGLPGVDALILGSVTEFGRRNEGKKGFLSATKKQVAYAKVDIRLVDVRTGYVFFAASGSGESTTESGEIAGFGSRADYDATLNDQALGAAVSDVMNEVIQKLEERPWRTDILKVEGKTIYMTGGQRQGLEVGDVLALLKPGETVKSQQTGFDIALPPAVVGTVTVTAVFGDNDVNEGSIAEVQGEVATEINSSLVVGEMK